MTGIIDQSAHEIMSTLRVQEQDKLQKIANMSKVSPKIGFEKSLKRVFEPKCIFWNTYSYQFK